MSLKKKPQTNARTSRNSLPQAVPGRAPSRGESWPPETSDRVDRSVSPGRPNLAFSISMRGRRAALYFAVVAVWLVLAVGIGVAVGSAHVGLDAVARVMAAHLLPAGWVDMSGIGQSEQAVVWLIRAPRVLVAALVGAALAVAGAQMQSLFRNPLASPGIVGTSSGGALGAVVALVTGLGTRSLFYVPILAFLGALLALLAVYGLATRHGRAAVATLLLAGVALSALIDAAISFLITMTSVRYEVAQEIIFWLMGGLDSRTWSHVYLTLPCIAVGGAVALFYTRELDLFLTDEETARSLGVEIERVKRIILTSAALLTGAAVAASGVVAFVGLIIPHIVRLIVGPMHRYVLPASALTGAVFLICADLLARTLRRPEEIRLGIITAAFGAPFFLYLLLRHRQEISAA